MHPSANPPQNVSTYINGIEHIENAYFYYGQAQPSATVNIASAVRRFFESLKDRYESRYHQKLDGYFEITLQVSTDWNNQRPQTVKEKYDRSANTGEAVKLVNEAFQQHGRLLIVGSPGAGKTVLLLKLAISLLERCDFRRKDWSFPVIFNLASWSDRYESFEDWLIAMLVHGNGLSEAFAKSLLQEKRLILLLDGLDELARNEDEATASKTRADCMRSLNKYLTHRLQTVICCRRDEFIQMQEFAGQDAPVSAKVEVLDLTEDDVKSALVAAQKENYVSASNLLDIINKNEAFLRVLKTPFYFTIIFEIFDQQIIDKRYKSKFVADSNYKNELYLKYMLVHHFVRKKFYNEVYPRVEYPRFIPDSLLHGFLSSYDPMREEGWVMHLALIMKRRQLVTFELADLQPEDLEAGIHPQYIYYLVFSILGALIGSVLTIFFIVLFQPVDSFKHKIYFIENISDILIHDHSRLIALSLFGLILGVICSLGASLLNRRIETRDKYKLNLISLFRPSNWGKASERMSDRGCCLLWSLFVFAGVTSLLSVVSSWLNIFSTFFMVVTGIAFMLFAVSIGIWLLVYLSALFDACKIGLPFAAIKSPYERFKAGIVRTARNIFLLVTLNILIGVYLAYQNYQSVSEMYLKRWMGILINIVSISLILLILFTAPIFKHWVLRLCFFLTGMMPLRYATFLDYAAKVRVLEKDGGYWRFRHQNIQDFLGNIVEGRTSDGVTEWKLRR